MQFLITNDSEYKIGLDIILQSPNKDLSLYGNDPALNFKINDDNYFLFGFITGIRQENGKIKKDFEQNSIAGLFEDNDFFNRVEGRFIFLKISKDFSFKIKSDKQSKLDIFLQEKENKIFISSGASLLPAAKEENFKVDNIGLMQATYIYGGRPLKKHSLFKDVFRLGVLETLSFDSSEGLKIFKEEKKKYKKIDFGNEESALKDYSDRFLESVKSCASKDRNNVVFLSSGWDSTSILGALVHLFSKDKTKAIIGRMKYSERSEIANSFEIKRAKEITDYYGVDLEIVDLDYTKDAEKIFTKLKDTFKSQQFTSLTGFNHWLLAEHASKNFSKEDVFFAGEMSDGAHNFGFSQYATIFHPSSYDFREYSDKMNTYLFGPTFLKVLIDKKQDNDPVWNFFKTLKPEGFFENIKEDEQSIKKQFLKSFFVRSGRIPLSKNNSNLLTDFGKKELDSVTFNTYLKKHADRLTPENLYSIFLDCYDNFHWQGSTVATLYHACEAYDLKCFMPFHDSYLLDYLSQMPESFGRGLELRPTKFPLKWTLKNIIDYPYELQTGPHSYTYDIDPSFSHAGEIINYSSFSNLWRKSLSSENYLNFLDKEFFNISYINGLVEKYLSKEELVGDEINDTLNIAMQDMLIFSR